MSAIDTLIKINISLQTSAVPRASFSIPLIIGSSMTGWNTDRIRSYTDPADMLSDGFTSSSPEYIYAQELMEQAQSPAIFYVGRRTAAVKQVDNVAIVTATAAHQYKVTIDGVDYSYTAAGGDTQSDIATALRSAINADSNCAAAATGSGANVVLTAKVFGAGFSTSINADSLMALTHPTPNNGIQDDINAIIAANNDWYGIVLCSNADYDLNQMAALVETLKKICFAVSNDNDIPTSVTTDIFSVMKGKGYNRTVPMYSPGSYNKGIDAAWMGGQLPATPGSNNWAYKTLVGISPDAISDNQRSILIGTPIAQIKGKNVNVYTTVGGKAITQMGTAASGQFIDITIGRDWLESTLQANIYDQLAQLAKIPYTDKGTGILISAVKAAIDQGVTNGLIDGDSPIEITAPAVLDVPASQRANRVAPTISFSCRLQGAFNAVDVEGTVTV